MTAVKPGSYHDSVALMRVTRELSERDGVTQAAAVMATPQNKEILQEAGLLTEEAGGAGPGDLVVVVQARDAEAAEAALAAVDGILAPRTQKGGGSGGGGPEGYGCGVGAGAGGGRTKRQLLLGDAVGFGAGLASISVPGTYAAAEAAKALKLGMHVFLFSNNVGLDDEVELKRYASDRRLLMMGPDCGTALIGGVPLGFCNVVRPGNIGIVAASGTGAQEVMTLVHRGGGGISRVIGTGSRDLHREVGGLTMLRGLELLQEDEDTKVVVLISKPPSPEVAEELVRAAAAGPKPVVRCFLGLSGAGADAGAGADPNAVAVLADAVRRALELAGAGVTTVTTVTDQPNGASPKVHAGAGFLRGLFSGGTLAAEALFLLTPLLGEVHTNLSFAGARTLANPNQSQGHTIVDLGDEIFTRGRPHPMIDYSYRIERLEREATDPAVGVILMDVMLGFGSHPDPAAELAPAVAEAVRQGKAVVVTVVGTDLDPQGLARQVAQLQEAGALVAPTNAQAARWAAALAAGPAEQTGQTGQRGRKGRRESR